MHHKKLLNVLFVFGTTCLAFLRHVFKSRHDFSSRELSTRFGGPVLPVAALRGLASHSLLNKGYSSSQSVNSHVV